MKHIHLVDATISLPMPVFLIIEDVGWWQGEDGSAKNEPYRNSFGRRHCLADYQALARLAERLSMRIALGLILGEWDRTNFLKDIPGATWMGTSWDNRLNQGPWLDEAADFLRGHSPLLEIALHGICHEFWQEGRMLRTEFHDRDCRMRSAEIVRSHLRAFGTLLEQNGLPDFPRLFIPPGLYHSFGNGDDSIQALLHDFGIDYVTTRFSRARRYAQPIHPHITWESGVALLERGMSPVNWDVTASLPVPYEPNPVTALHWGNLLHMEPERNGEIVDAWADMFINRTRGLDSIPAEDLAACWCQAAVFYLAKMKQDAGAVIIDLKAIPDLPCFTGPFYLKIEQKKPVSIGCIGAEILSRENESENVLIVKLFPEKGRKRVILSFESCSAYSSDEREKGDAHKIIN